MNLNISIAFFSLSLLLAGCTSDPQAELDQLKVKKAEIETAIRELEAQLKSNGTDSTADHGHLVLVQTLKAEIFRNYVEVQGMVDAEENILLSAEIGGNVTKVLVKAGQQVNKGQLLAETDSKIILKGIAELQTALDLANTLYEKQKNLWDQKIGTEVQYLAAKSQKEGLEKKMQSLQEQLELTRITSPIDGTIDAVYAKVGQMLGPGMPVVTVVNFNGMKVKAEVPESYAGKVKTGNEVFVYFPDMKDSVTGKLSYAARVINPLNRTFTAEMMLDNKKEYHPNMIAVLRIADYVSPAPGIVISSSVIMKGEDGTEYVMVADGNTAKKVVILTGKKYRGRIEVTQGLKEGDRLIVTGFQELNGGDVIKVKPE
ncbi:MAG: efflux RND transporter periplasmic adaptor subunit [Bacteroidia bacterium]|nr:efflux RND transporter periplasmic adaptor subunit [Bacteroidia bacterium]